MASQKIATEEVAVSVETQPDRLILGLHVVPFSPCAPCANIGGGRGWRDDAPCARHGWPRGIVARRSRRVGAYLDGHAGGGTADAFVLRHSHSRTCCTHLPWCAVRGQVLSVCHMSDDNFFPDLAPRQYPAETTTAPYHGVATAAGPRGGGGVAPLGRFVRMRWRDIWCGRFFFHKRMMNTK